MRHILGLKKETDVERQPNRYCRQRKREIDRQKERKIEKESERGREIERGRQREKENISQDGQGQDGGREEKHKIELVEDR